LGLGLRCGLGVMKPALVDDWIALVRASGYKLSKLAAHGCGISKRHLRRWFEANALRPPQEWLDEVRIWEAARLLCAGSSVKETSASLSFASQSHFTRRFKSYMGCTPSEFPQLERARLVKKGKFLHPIESEFSWSDDNGSWAAALQILNKQPKRPLREKGVTITTAID
jgi:AraC-like DNA-binding protein